MTVIRMSGETSHDYKLRQYNQYNRMEQIHNDKALESFKRPVYQQQISSEKRYSNQ
jgi:hypothetical protein